MSIMSGGVTKLLKTTLFCKSFEIVPATIAFRSWALFEILNFVNPCLHVQSLFRMTCLATGNPSFIVAFCHVGIAICSHVMQQLE